MTAQRRVIHRCCLGGKPSFSPRPPKHQGICEGERESASWRGTPSAVRAEHIAKLRCVGSCKSLSQIYLTCRFADYPRFCGAIPVSSFVFALERQLDKRRVQVF